jgi:putative FmdB family regulatory protein
MPTYDYICENCGSEFERFQSITAGPIRKCPLCGRKELKRLIGAGSGVIFKGPGFYQTDYRSESYKNAKKNDKSATDTKPSKEKPQNTKAAAGPEKKNKKNSA